MALIGAYDDEPHRSNIYADAGYQRYLAFLESQVRGKPGMPVENPEPFQPVGAAELVDGPVVAPEPGRPKGRRRRKQVRPQDIEPRGNTDLARYARKLKGEP